MLFLADAKHDAKEYTITDPQRFAGEAKCGNFNATENGAPHQPYRLPL